MDVPYLFHNISISVALGLSAPLDALNLLVPSSVPTPDNEIRILLSRHAGLSDIGPVSRKMVEWASSEPWYSDLILTDDGDDWERSWQSREDDDSDDEDARTPRTGH